MLNNKLEESDSSSELDSVESIDIPDFPRDTIRNPTTFITQSKIVRHKRLDRTNLVILEYLKLIVLILISTYSLFSDLEFYPKLLLFIVTTVSISEAWIKLTTFVQNIKKKFKDEDNDNINEDD